MGLLPGLSLICCEPLVTLTGLPITVLVPALNGLAALLALMVLYVAARRFASRSVAIAVVALVATSMAMPVWTLAYSDTMGLLGVVTALALLAARRYGMARRRPFPFSQ